MICNLRVAEAERRILDLPDITASSAQELTVHWHHSAILRNGDVISGSKTPDLLRAEFHATFDQLPIGGATVLDIGAWNGAFAFEAERRGALRVVAVDKICWLHEELRGLESFLLLKKDKRSSVEYKIIDLSQTNAQKLGRFNIVLFLGVFYHLQEPISYLHELARLANPWLVLETHCDLIDDPLPAMRYYPFDELGGDGSNWWGPNPPCVVRLLEHAGFADITVTRHPFEASRFFFHARSQL